MIPFLLLFFQSVQHVVWQNFNCPLFIISLTAIISATPSQICLVLFIIINTLIYWQWVAAMQTSVDWYWLNSTLVSFCCSRRPSTDKSIESVSNVQTCQVSPCLEADWILIQGFMAIIWLYAEGIKCEGDRQLFGLHTVSWCGCRHTKDYTMFCESLSFVSQTL